MAGRLPQPGGEQRDQSKFIVFEGFEKMDTQSARQGLSEKALAWQENLQYIAGNNLVTVPAPAASPLVSISENITEMFYASINGIDYFITFTTAGSGYAINIATGAVNHFAPDGTFTNPDVTTWEASRVLINDPTAGYSTWDGTLFVRQGGVSPNITVTAGGSGYSTAPPVTISGGSGTGATAHSVIVNGEVVQVILDNPGTGYQAGDTLSVAFGTGAGSGAAGHVTMTGFPVSNVTIANTGLFASPAPGFYPGIALTGGGGSGATANVTVSTTGGADNFVSFVALASAGSGYTSVPTLPFATGGTQPSFNVFLGTESVATIVKDANGTGYVAPPTVTIQGGLGPGGVAATAHATESGGAVTALVLDTAGSGYVSTPSVVIGTGTGATAIAHVWPFVPAGTTLAVFQGRVWLNGLNSTVGENNILQWTGTGATYGDVGYDDFLAADASGSLILSDADLIHAITALRSLNNYLWVMGDQSVKQIGNISLNADADITLFTILTISSDQGTIYPKSCISYNRIFMFANTNGIYGVFGSSVQKLSSDLDGIFKLIDFTQSPQGALIDLNAIHNAGFLVRYKDPVAVTRSLILTFDGRRWYFLQQGNSLTAFATSAALATGQNSLYGSSGTDVTQLLAAPSTAVAFKYQTSLTHHGNAIQGKKTIRSGFAAALATGSGSVTLLEESETAANPYTIAVASGFHTPPKSVEASGIYLGHTITGTLAGFTLTLSAIEYQETDLWPG